MAAERKLVHVERITVRWADMDALGHVNNAVYFRYMEQARISFVERLCSLLAVIANASCTFKRPLTYPAVVEISLYAGAPGNSSLETYCEFRVGGDTEVVAYGSAMMIFVDRKENRPVRVPDEVRNAVARGIGEIGAREQEHPTSL